MIEIRSIRKEDNKRLAEIIRSPFEEFGVSKVHTVYDDPDTDRQFETFSEELRAELWVAVDGTEVLGSCGIFPTAGLPDGWCEVVKFYVDRRLRGQGIGSRLFAKALQSAVAFGYQTAYLETFPQLAGAVKMYGRLGFQPIDHQVGNSGHTATSIWMTKNLATETFRDSNRKWTVLTSENFIHRPYFDAFVEKVKLPGGKVYDDFYHLHFSPVVCIVAETADGKLLLERQYRNAIHEMLTEIPAGVMEEGEQPVEAAKRELCEETGFSGGVWRLLAVEYAQGGVQDNKMYSFYARGVVPTSRRHLDDSEDIKVCQMDKAQVWQMLLGGAICQAPLATALWKYFALYGSGRL
ncbi:MAG: GNAT family N-acetyltransferase [Prevotella sp.]|jgi:GNAT superfamily N-acetyltransferase/8-oxo-dGTP pyrophosphatase MutT (NUDIX family)